MCSQQIKFNGGKINGVLSVLANWPDRLWYSIFVQNNNVICIVSVLPSASVLLFLCIIIKIKEGGFIYIYTKSYLRCCFLWTVISNRIDFFYALIATKTTFKLNFITGDTHSIRFTWHSWIYYYCILKYQRYLPRTKERFI